MANMKKFKSPSAYRILDHFERQKNADGELKYQGDVRIDEDRSYLNLFYPDSIGGRQRLKQRLVEVAPKRRKDAVIMVDWVVTLPQQLINAERREQLVFFDHTIRFLQDRYGEDNLVRAYIHYDQTTPHLHYCFVPVATDSNGIQRLCAKEVITRAELGKFHHDLDKELEQIYGKSGIALKRDIPQDEYRNLKTSLKRKDEELYLLRREVAIYRVLALRNSSFNKENQ